MYSSTLHVGFGLQLGIESLFLEPWFWNGYLMRNKMASEIKKKPGAAHEPNELREQKPY